MRDYLTVLLFFLPAGISNMAPVIANKIPILNKWDTPMDFGIKYKGVRLFGDNKRWRGILFGTLVAGLTAVIINKLSHETAQNYPPFYVGCALGFGALLGDAVESFFKRIRGINPGSSWFPFDQLDYIAGGLLFAYPFAPLPVREIIAVVVVYFSLHIATAYIGYMLGLKDKPI